MMRRSVSALFLACLLSGTIGAAVAAQAAQEESVPPGPPYPDPIEGVRVYDQAGVLGPFTRGVAETTIDEIEERSGAQVVVYTQVKPDSDTFEEAQADAAALMEQWSIGRDGVDDGLVVLFDLDPGLCYGQIQLYAGAGYAAEHLSNAERQTVFEEDMVPPLGDCDFDTALLAAMTRIAAAAGAGPQTNPGPSTATPETTVPSMTVEDIFPRTMRDGALSVRDVGVYRTEAELFEFLVGAEPDPEEVDAVRAIAESAGRNIEDLTIVDGWFDLDDGNSVVNLGAFQIQGATTDDVRQSLHALAMAWMGDPAYADQEIGGKVVTVYDTSETLERVNYLYVYEDTGWIFATVEEYAADVMDALPGPTSEQSDAASVYAPADVASALPTELRDTSLSLSTWTSDEVLGILGDQGLRDLLLPFDKAPRDLHVATARDALDPSDGANIMAVRVEGVDGESLIQPLIEVLFLPQLSFDTPVSELDLDWREVDGIRVGVWDDLLGAGAGWIFFYPKGEVMLLAAQNQSDLTIDEVLAGLR